MSDLSQPTQIIWFRATNWKGWVVLSSCWCGSEWWNLTNLTNFNSAPTDPLTAAVTFEDLTLDLMLSWQMETQFHDQILNCKVSLPSKYLQTLTETGRNWLTPPCYYMFAICYIWTVTDHNCLQSQLSWVQENILYLVGIWSLLDAPSSCSWTCWMPFLTVNLLFCCYKLYICLMIWPH